MIFGRLLRQGGWQRSDRVIANKLWYEFYPRVIAIVQEVSCTPAQLVLAYCLQNQQVSSLLFGATKVAQGEDNLHTLAILPRINQEVMANLRQPAPRSKV